MNVRVTLLSCVTVLCLVATVMAGPIQINTPSGTGDITGSRVQQGPDFRSSMHSPTRGNVDLSGSALLTTGVDRVVELGGHPDPGPNAVPVPEPSGLMVMFGSGLFGVVAWMRRKLTA